MKQKKERIILEQVRNIKSLYEENSNELHVKLLSLIDTIKGTDKIITILDENSNDIRKEIINAIKEFAERFCEENNKDEETISEDTESKKLDDLYNIFIEKISNYLRLKEVEKEELLKRPTIEELILDFTKIVKEINKKIKFKLQEDTTKIKTEIFDWNNLGNKNSEKACILLRKIINFIPKENEYFREVVASLEENLYTNDKTNCNKLYENFLLEYLRIIDKDRLELKSNKEEITKLYEKAHCNRINKSFIEQSNYEKIYKKISKAAKILDDNYKSVEISNIIPTTNSVREITNEGSSRKASTGINISSTEIPVLDDSQNSNNNLTKQYTDEKNNIQNENEFQKANNDKQQKKRFFSKISRNHFKIKIVPEQQHLNNTANPQVQSNIENTESSSHKKVGFVNKLLKIRVFNSKKIKQNTK